MVTKIYNENLNDYGFHYSRYYLDVSVFTHAFTAINMRHYYQHHYFLEFDHSHQLYKW